MVAMRLVIRLRTASTPTLALALLLTSAAPFANAQQVCEQGIVRLPGSVNGQITICPALAAQDPAVTRQIAALQQVMVGQQSELQGVTRLLKSLNMAGALLTLKQQSELLRNVLERVGDPQSTSADHRSLRYSSLSSHFEEVAAKIDVVLEDPRTSPTANASLHGQTGDAISRLDFETAADQLDIITAQLKQINNTTRTTLSTVEAIRQDQLLAQQQAAAQQAEARRQQELQQRTIEQAQREQTEKSLNDPKRFVTITLQALGFDSAWKVHAYLSHQGEPLTDPRLEVLAMSGERLLRMNFPLSAIVVDRQSPEIDVTSITDKITVCFSAFDPRVSGRRLWKGSFQAEMHSLGGKFSDVRYNPIGPSTLTPDLGAPCQPDTSARGSANMDSSAMVTHPNANYTITLAFREFQRQANGPWLLIGSGGGHFAEDTKLQVLLTTRGHSQLVDIAVPKVINTTFKAGEVAVASPGEHAVVCFSAVSQGQSKRMMLRQTYDLQRRVGSNIVDFQTSANPTFTEDNGQPCR